VPAIDGTAPVHTPYTRTETAHPEFLHTETAHPVLHSETAHPVLRTETPRPILRTETARPEVWRSEPIHIRVPRSETEPLRGETPHPRILRSETAQPLQVRGTPEPAPHPAATHGTRRRPNGGHVEAGERATPR
jgi:hypothetical protein